MWRGTAWYGGYLLYGGYLVVLGSRVWKGNLEWRQYGMRNACGTSCNEGWL